MVPEPEPGTDPDCFSGRQVQWNTIPGKTFCSQQDSRDRQAQPLTRHDIKKEGKYATGSMTPLKTLLIVLGAAAIVGSLIEIFGPSVETAKPQKAQPANELIILK